MASVSYNPLLPVAHRSCSTSAPFRLLRPGGIRRCGTWALRGASLAAPRAKFREFDAQEVPMTTATDDSGDEAEVPTAGRQEEEREEDSDLPCDLEDAIRQSGRAAALFVSSGGMRSIVELLIPQLQFLDAEGAQEELWGLSRIFLETLIQETGGMQRVKAIFPDAGAAALLQYQWKDAAFGFSSLSDRRPVEDGDDIVVMIVPDYQMLEYVERIASRLSDDPEKELDISVNLIIKNCNNESSILGEHCGCITPSMQPFPFSLPRPLLMWNPRLVSEDVGVGFNVRKLRRYFLSTFTTVYSMRPLESGAVFRCYPGMWKVFYDDKDRPNRYRIAKELASRPDATDLEQIFGDLTEKTEERPSVFVKAMGMFSSINRFMKAISK